MQRATFTLDDDLVAAIDARAAERGYGSRSEAVRDLLREALGAGHPAAPQGGTAYGTLSYVYDHGTRDLARRLTGAQHAHHELTVASLHVHLDHDTCLEVAVLHGPAVDLRALSDGMTSQRGVRFGHLHLVPAGDRDAVRHHGHARRETANGSAGKKT